MMFFGEYDVRKRKSFGRRRRGKMAVLQVSARVSRQRGTDMRHVRIAGAAVLALVAAAALVFVGVRFADKALFRDNPRFVITNLAIIGGDDVVRDFIRGKHGITEGVNLYDVNMAGVRRDFLERSPNYKSMEIMRVLPDTLTVRVEERVPVARIGWQGHLAVDCDGSVFASQSASRALPLIAGRTGEGLNPGVRVAGIVRAAIEVVQACDAVEIDLPVSAVNVPQSEESVLVILANGKKGRLRWKGMGSMTEESGKRLRDIMREWKRIMATPEGRRESEFNLTFPVAEWITAS